MKLALLFATTSSALFLLPTDAKACSEPSRSDFIDQASLEGFPVNGIVFDVQPPTWQDSNGTPVVFDRVEAFSSVSDVQTWLAGWRPRGLQANAEYRRMCDSLVCETFIARNADETPPAAASVREMTTNLREDEQSGCMRTCGGSTVNMEVHGLTQADVGPQFLLTYVADNANDAAALPRPTIAYYLSAQFPVVWSRLDDDSGGRTFSNAEGSCFTIALMDRAGNVGPRSAPECYTPDAEDGGCTAAARSSLWTALIAIAAAVGVRRRRRSAAKLSHH